VIESLEDRRMFSVAAPHVAAALTVPRAQPAVVTNAVTQASVNTVLPTVINAVQVIGGQLVAIGSIGGIPFLSQITATPTAVTATSSVLDLTLAPIHLNVLGLTVDTSKICLNITAQQGAGNLLGNLLFGVTHLLDQGVSLNTILGAVGSTDLGNLLNGISGLLNGALAQVTLPSSLRLLGNTLPNVTNILNLSLGPVDLNLLGLDVHLDNCDGGPVTVDVAAVAGPGNLLGNLLTSVAHLLNSATDPGALTNALGQVVNQVLTLQVVSGILSQIRL